jgi:hypothetical protein
VAQLRREPAGRIASLVEAQPGSLRNKAWAARFRQCSVALSAAWWIGSLPFRLAVYQRGKTPQSGSGARSV